MTAFIILPGIGGSGEDHWQTRWQKADPAMRRFSPASWERPGLEDWISALDEAVSRSDEPPILVAHSLACLLVAHWQARPGRSARGAFLVAVPDPESSVFPSEAAPFANAPTERLRFPALMLASADDPYGAVAYAERRAAGWGCGLIVLGPLGHINGSSGLGDWPEGRERLDRFVAQLP
jgi:predicted alpha/beta hydrolase family esterase